MKAVKVAVSTAMRDVSATPRGESAALCGVSATPCGMLTGQDTPGARAGLCKNPGFSSKTQPSGFNWFKPGFNGFYGLNWGKFRFPM